MELDGRPIGYLQFYAADPVEYGLDASEEDTWAFDLFIGEPDLWEQGLGTTIVRATVDYLLGEAGARKIVIDPRVANHRAIHVYGKAGFRKVKVLKEHEPHDGVMEDCWLMELVVEG
jgi:aminoglycoside 6'-N-acetyltransferase